MHTEHTVLLISADGRVHDEVAKALEVDPGYRLILCQSEAAAAARLHEIEAHLIICDADLITDLAANVLVDARISHPQVARVLLGSAESPEHCAQVARRAATYLYVLKPVPPDQIGRASCRERV